MRRIDDFSTARTTSETGVSSFGRVFPAVVLAGHMIAWCSKLKSMTPFARTSEFNGLGLPRCIMMMFFPNESMGYFMEEGVEDIWIGCIAGQLKGDGDLFVAKVATSGSTGAVVEVKGPVG